MENSNRLITRIAILLVFSTLAVTVRADEASIKQAGVDLYGDPLPEGAIARLGTSRLLPAEAVWAIALSPDGKTVATGSHPGSLGGIVELWNTADGRKICRMFAGANNIMSIAWSPDSQEIAISRDYRLEVWSVNDRAKLFELPNGEATLENSIWHLRWTSDGRSVVGISRRKLHVWHVETKKLIWSKEYFQELEALDVSDNDTLIAIGGSEFIELRDRQSFELRHRVRATGTVKSVAFSADGNQLVCSAETEKWRTRLAVWNTKSGQKLAQSSKFDCYKCDADFSFDGHIVFAMSDKLGFWKIDAAEPRFIPCKGQSYWFLSLSKKRSLAVTGEWRVQLWDLRKEQPVFDRPTHTGVHRDIFFGPEGNTLTACTGFAIRKWNYRTGEPMSVVELPQEMHGFASSPSGKTLAIIDEGGYLTICDADGKHRKVLHRGQAYDRHGSSVRWGALAFSRDGKKLAAADWDRHVRIFKLDDETILADATLESQANRVVWSADGSQLAVCSMFEDVQILDARRLNKLVKIENSRQPIFPPAPMRPTARRSSSPATSSKPQNI